MFSRRQSEKMINDGYILINGVVEDNHLFDVSNDDNVTFHPKISSYAKQLGIVLINKPRGVWTNCKQGNKEKEVMDLLPKRFKGYSSIGRLDKDSEGLILFTNHGPFANQFLNAGEEHQRIYSIRTKTPLTHQHLLNLKKGVFLDDGLTKPCDIYQIKNNAYEIVLTEGKNRQIRRMIEWCGTYVTFLKRLTFSEYKLGSLKPGEFRFLSLELSFLKKAKSLGLIK